jgi:hypothetical protein
VKKVAIMQPTYLPWVGYFALMAAVDEFVFLDDVQFARRSWQQRNRVKGPSGELMLTIPVFKKGKREQPIDKVEIDWSTEFASKHVRTIEVAYAKASHIGEYWPAIADLLRRKTVPLADYTIDLIAHLRSAMGIKTPLSRSSTLQLAGKRENRLVAICEALGAKTYISPMGSQVYLEGSDAFASAGIELLYDDYAHPTYPQLHGDFVSHLSAVDLLLNCGGSSLEVLTGGTRLTPAASIKASTSQPL